MFCTVPLVAPTNVPLLPNPKNVIEKKTNKQNFLFSTLKARTNQCGQIHIPLWITMPMWTIHCDNRGRKPSQCGIIRVTRIQSRKAAVWWVWTVAKLLWIIWRDHGLHFPASHHSFDNQQSFKLQIKQNKQKNISNLFYLW